VPLKEGVENPPQGGMKIQLQHEEPGLFSESVPGFAELDLMVHHTGRCNEPQNPVGELEGKHIENQFQVPLE
jgi:hypothetical protein